jgi:hypothetical protein
LRTARQKVIETPPSQQKVWHGGEHPAKWEEEHGLRSSWAKKNYAEPYLKITKAE